MQKVNINIKILEHGEGLEVPSYATTGSAGVDLRAAISENEPITLKPLERKIVPTGISIALPEGFEAQVRPRSGLAAKHGLTVLNSPGTVDSDYRGEICVILVNLSSEEFTINRGERIAQMIIAPFAKGYFYLQGDLDETARGTGGFGSTGKI